MKRNKEIKRFIRAAKAAGWKIERTRKGYRFLHPNGTDTVGCHTNMSDHRAPQKTISDFKRLGLDV